MAQSFSGRRSIKSGALSTETVFIAICCVCGLVRVRKTFPMHAEQWVTKRAYEKKYGIALIGKPVTHTYCPGCYTDFMQRVTSSRHTSGPSPN
jgi:hypothetical protein